MKVTLEFDDSLKPVLATMLSPAFDKMRQNASTLAAKFGDAPTRKAYEMLCSLDVSLNIGKGDANIQQPL